MPVKVVWSDKAVDDLDSLAGYIAKDNPQAAVRYLASLHENCNKLTEFPESGRTFGAKHRVIVVRNHLVLYRFDREAKEILIVTVVDGRRDVSKLVETF